MCLFPINATIDDCGKIKFTREGELRLPCSKCTECISKRAADWALRASHEIASHDENCFLNLTYNNENLLSNVLQKNDFQKFIKRLRKKLKKPIRYMVSGEYGEKTKRPHFHAIIFGYNPPNQTFYKNTPAGDPLFESEEISKLWIHGDHKIGQANEKTAFYIASYALKSKKHKIIDYNTGEETTVSDYMDCSKRPAIGYEFFKENYEQLINSGKILPRYYLKKLAEINPQMHMHYENERMFNLKNRGSHEILAKYTIDQEKIKLSKTEFREFDENIKESKHLKEKLKSNRDEYHHINLSKGDKK